MVTVADFHCSSWGWYFLVLTLLSVFVVKGHAAGPHWEKGGSGSNFLCLPENPQWRNYIDGNQQLTGYIYGI